MSPKEYGDMLFALFSGLGAAALVYGVFEHQRDIAMAGAFWCVWFGLLLISHVGKP